MKKQSTVTLAAFARLSQMHRFIGRWLMAGLFASLISSAKAADVPFMVVMKGQCFEQVSSTVAFMDERSDEEPLLFEAFVLGETTNSVVAGSVETPDGEQLPLTREDPEDSTFMYEYRTDNLLDLNTSKTNGTYTIHVTTEHDGTQIIPLNLVGDNYPNVPLISNYTSLQSANHSTAITVQWDAMTGGTMNDFIMCSIFDESTGEDLYESGGPGAPDALNGTSTQVVLPSDRLQPGHAYRAELLFVKLADSNTTSYPGAQALAGYYKMLSFPIKTTALPGTALGATLEGVIPRPYAWGIPRDSAIAFRFSHPMDPNYSVISWTGTGVDSDGFEHEWVEGNTVLLCKYDFDLPANIEVGWTLDLSGFRDAAGFQLTGNSETGSFHTSSNEPQTPPDADFIFVGKTREYQQTGGVPVSSGVFSCFLEVELNAFNRVKEASVIVGANSRSLPLQHDEWGAEMGGDATFASQTDLDYFFANGDFTFNLNTLSNGLKTVAVSLGATDDYPEVPTVTNLSELQNLDEAAPFTIAWNPLIGWSSSLAVGNQIIQIEIENEQENEVFYIDPEEFTSGAQCTIPADVLSPGRTYEVGLTFFKIKDLNDASYPGVFAAGVFLSSTSFTIQTAGNPQIPDLIIERVGGNINLNFTAGEKDWCYILETSRDLQRWLPYEFVPGAGSYFDGDAHYLTSRFYRIRDCAAGEEFQRNRSIQGTVWTDDSQITPVADALVGTSMDDQVILTDQNGQFFLETDTPNGSGEYWVEVTRGTTKKYFGSFTGDQPRDQNFPMDQVQDTVSIGGTVWTDSSHTVRVENATVGTSLDGEVAVTDVTGIFFLQTNTPANYGDTPYTITITVGGITRFSESQTWGDHPTDQNFELN